MTDIEAKALALVNEVRSEWGLTKSFSIDEDFPEAVALCRAIEQHEATKQEFSDFRQLVSDVVRGYLDACRKLRHSVYGPLESFVISAPKPDPLAQVLEDIGWGSDEEEVNNLRAGLEARGLEIREKGQ
jgi:hypothetical protein